MSHNRIARMIGKHLGGAPTKRFVKAKQQGTVRGEENPVLIRKVPVLWGIPCDELMYARFFSTFFQHANIMPWDGLAFSEGTYLPEARNFIHNAYLEDSDLPYLMMMDSDILFPPNIVERLMAHHVPLVGGWYRNKAKKTPVVFDFVEDDAQGIGQWRNRAAPGTGLERVDGTGAGCWLMTREVAEKLGRNPYDMNTGGEDMVLCRKLMKLGIPLHVDWDVNCAHLGVFHI